MFEPVVPVSPPAAALPAGPDVRPEVPPAPGGAPADPAPSRTANGLPVRRPQATFATPERPAGGPYPGDPPPAPAERSAERVRDFVGAAVLGTREARRASAAARERHARHDEGDGAPPPAGGRPRS